MNDDALEAVAPTPAEPNGWYYLSFAGGGGWRGAVVVRGLDMREAIAEAWRLRVNPGGSVHGFALDAATGVPPAEFRERLLDEDDARRMDVAMGGDGEVVRVRL